MKTGENERGKDSCSFKVRCRQSAARKAKLGKSAQPVQVRSDDAAIPDRVCVTAADEEKDGQQMARLAKSTFSAARNSNCRLTKKE